MTLSDPVLNRRLYRICKTAMPAEYRGDLWLRDSQLIDASGKPVLQCDVALPILPEPLFRKVDNEVALLSGLRNCVMP